MPKEMKLHLIFLVLNWCLPLAKAFPTTHPQWRKQSRYVMDNGKEFLFETPFLEVYNEESDRKFPSFTEETTRKSIPVDDGNPSSEGSDEESNRYRKYRLTRTMVDRDGAVGRAFEIRDEKNPEHGWKTRNFVRIRADGNFRVGGQSPKQEKVYSEQLTLMAGNGENEFESTKRATLFGVKKRTDSLSEKKVDEPSGSPSRQGEFIGKKSNSFDLDKGEKSEEENKIEMRPKGRWKTSEPVRYSQGSTVNDPKSEFDGYEKTEAKNYEKFYKLMEDIKYAKEENNYGEEYEMNYDEVENDETVYRDEEDKYEEPEKNYEQEEEKNYEEEEKNYEKEEINYETEEKNYGEKEKNYKHGEKNHKTEEKNFEEEEKNYEDEKKNYEDEEKNYEEEEKDYEDEEKNYEEEENNYEKEEKNYEAEEKNYQEEEKNYEDEEKNYEEKEKIYEDEEKNYEKEEKNYEEEEKNFEEEEKIYEEEEKNYEEEEKNFEEEEKNYETEEKNFEEEEKIYEEEEKNYEQEEKISEQAEKKNYRGKEKNREAEKKYEKKEEKIDVKEEEGRKENKYEADETVDGLAANEGGDETWKKFRYVVDGENYRKYRVEERTSDGFILGEYGVVKGDDGSLRAVRYAADGATNPQLIYNALLRFLSL